MTCKPYSYALTTEGNRTSYTLGEEIVFKHTVRCSTSPECINTPQNNMFQYILYDNDTSEILDKGQYNVSLDCTNNLKYIKEIRFKPARAGKYKLVVRDTSRPYRIMAAIVDVSGPTPVDYGLLSLNISSLYIDDRRNVHIITKISRIGGSQAEPVRINVQINNSTKFIKTISIMPDEEVEVEFTYNSVADNNIQECYVVKASAHILKTNISSSVSKTVCKELPPKTKPLPPPSPQPEKNYSLLALASIAIFGAILFTRG